MLNMLLSVIILGHPVPNRQLDNMLTHTILNHIKEGKHVLDALQKYKQHTL